LATTSQQLRHLISRAELPNVTIRIVPFTAGIHPMKGPFELIQFADTPDENIVFREITSDDSISDDPAEAQNYLDALTRITAVSPSPSDAVDRLRKAGFAATCPVYQNRYASVRRPEHGLLAPYQPDCPVQSAQNGTIRPILLT
jgi:Domain of unknown function (DUF5753)